MNRILTVIIFIGFLQLISCTQSDKANNRSSTNEISYVNLINSKNVELSLDERIRLINKSFTELTLESPDSISLAIISQKSNLHYKKQQKDSAFYYDQLLLNSSVVAKDNYYAGKSHFNIALYFKNLANSDSAFYHYNQSKNYYLNTNNFSQAGRRLISMAVIQQNQSDYFGSKETITEAVNYLKKENDAKYLASAFSVLASNHRRLLNFSDAIKYFSKAIESTPSKKDKLIYQNNLAATFIDKKGYKDAIVLLEMVLEDDQLIKNEKDYARVLDNLAYAQWLLEKKVEEHSFLKPLKMRKKNNDKRGQMASYNHLGEFFSKKNTKKASVYFDSVIQIAKTLKIPRAEKDAIQYLMSLYPKNVALKDRYVVLQDSLYEQELNVKTQFAKYKYDDKQKQESILRLEKTNAEKELEIAKQENQKIMFYAVGGILLLVFGFAIYFFIQRTKRLKQENKTVQLEATFETEAELSRKLHDDFGGKLNHAMLLLQNGVDSSEVLDVVDGLYNQSRDFSREINDVDTGPNFKDFLFGMMGNYSKNTKLIVSGSTDVDWLKIAPLSKKTLFKVLQELMINMQKHSDASLVSFVFEQTKKMLNVTYADDGAGASNEELNLKNGLWNTEKRIKAIGGNISFDSEKGRGFEVQIGIPN